MFAVFAVSSMAIVEFITTVSLQLLMLFLFSVYFISLSVVFICVCNNANALSPIIVFLKRTHEHCRQS